MSLLGLEHRRGISYRRAGDTQTTTSSQSPTFIMDGDFKEAPSWCPAFNRPFTSVSSLSPPKITYSLRVGDSWNPRQGSLAHSRQG